MLYMPNEDIFKIKPLDKNATKVVVNGQKTVSPFNSAKHLKTANIPALCDQCVYRSIEDGGNGKCPKYEKGALCAIRKDFIEMINQLDTRDPEAVKTMLDMLAKLSFENVLMALTESKFDGNIPDRNTKSEINTLLKIINTIGEISNKIVVSEEKRYDKKGDIESIFRQIKAQKTGD
jgi:hypothetical protein